MYLALSAKAERPVVDRLAWRIHSAEEVMAAREWRRIDLAIFRRGQEGPVALLEEKAFSSFAAVRQPDKYPAQISRDIEKAAELCGCLPNEAEIFDLRTHLTANGCDA